MSAGRRSSRGHGRSTARSSRSGSRGRNNRDQSRRREEGDDVLLFGGSTSILDFLTASNPGLQAVSPSAVVAALLAGPAVQTPVPTLAMAPLPTLGALSALAAASPQRPSAAMRALIAAQYPQLVYDEAAVAAAAGVPQEEQQQEEEQAVGYPTQQTGPFDGTGLLSTGPMGSQQNMSRIPPYVDRGPAAQPAPLAAILDTSSGAVLAPGFQEVRGPDGSVLGWKSQSLNTITNHKPVILPPGWSFHTTEAGQSFYINPTTGQSDWLPPGWTERRDEDGVTIYENTTTGEQYTQAPYGIEVFGVA